VGFEVENNRGTTLPGTGGIGTTIFYVVGGGLMVAAAILAHYQKAHGEPLTSPFPLHRAGL